MKKYFLNSWSLSLLFFDVFWFKIFYCFC